MKVLKNFTMHKVELSPELQKEWKVEEPGINKKWMLLPTDAIIRGKSTTTKEQKELIKRIAPYINRGDNILVAGHSTLVSSIEIVANIKGANVYVGYLHKKTKEIVRLDEKIIDYDEIKQIIGEINLNRADRLDIEHAGE
jgi:hypothetical protein